ncbi:phosphopentomutase [Stomoxys calcitrans]|uniref:Phosphoglucomutase-2 n=1 Tax=Stomoxys calcitrans TaxID=35570 RepID=A0A1I8PBJ4_STOCA|nr:phosphopentomutase [Stomoxys calcitrans]
MSTHSGDAKLDEQIELWLKWDRNEKTLNEIKQLIAASDWDQLKKRLLERLAFGTAGLRGCMRAGFDSMNDLVIVQTAQGLCEYIKKQYKPEEYQRGVVFGYDGRYNSKRFAELSSTIFVQNGIRVFLYGRMVATPFVPFAISQKKCLAGVMVTASHNPKEDNGYKVYWGNGAQIISPHDKGIQQCILENLEPLENSWDTSFLNGCSILEDPYKEMFESYYKTLLDHIPQDFLQINKKHRDMGELKFVYTAMHGVGWPYVEKAFSEACLPLLLPVEEQKEADPDFPTVKFPNPEEGKSSLELSIKKAEAEGVSIILANDPDADRLACAEKDPKTGLWKVFNGNELGALIGWWSVQNYKALHPNVDLADCYLLASTVSSKILRSMGDVDGYKFVETLTGFKWMGNEAIQLLNKGKQVLFAFEEAIGFMFSTSVLDKDGVSAATHLATMTCYLRETQGITLNEKLRQIYETYGYHCTNCSYLFCDKAPVIKRIFERLRNFQNGKPNTYPESILNGEFAIKHVRDLTTGVDTSQPDGKATLPVSSSTQMITFSFENGLVITLRTSGTEPKIKYYAELCAKPEEKDWPSLRDTLNRMVEAIVEEFLQPTLNDLKPKSD